MARKSETDPRRIYARKGATVVCFAGTYFGTRSESDIRTDHPAKVEGAGEGKVKVSQRVGHGKRVTETWGRVKLSA